MPYLGLLAAWLSAASPANSIASVHVGDSVDCPTQSVLQSALRDQIDRASGGLALEVFSADAEHLTLRLLNARGRVLTEKTIARKTETCADLTQTIVLLVASWTRELDAASAREGVVASQAALASTQVAQVPGVVEDAAIVQVGPPPEPRFARLALYLAIQGTLGDASGVGGTLGAEVSLVRRLALGAELTWMGNLSSSVPPGTVVSVDRQLVALLAKVLLLPPASEHAPSLSALGGVTFLHYSGSSPGYAAPDVAEGWKPGWMLGLRGVQPIFEGLFLYGEVAANAVAATLNFQVADGAGGATTVVTQPAFWPSLALGVGTNLF